MDTKEIGYRINLSRKEKKRTLQEIADATGLAKSTIQRYEKGLIERVKLPVIQAIAESLNVNPSWLVGKSDLKEYPTIKHTISLTEHEKTHVEKYRTLDDRGKTNVDNLLETEYQYILKQQEKEYEPKLIAAHVDGEWTDAHERDKERLKNKAIDLKKKHEGE